jgi:hypothetical protein
MTEDRLARTRGSSTDLRAARTQLRRRLTHYLNALVIWAAEDEDARVDQVWDALLPMVTLRSYLGRNGRRGDEELIAALDELDDDANDGEPDDADELAP